LAQLLLQVLLRMPNHKALNRQEGAAYTNAWPGEAVRRRRRGTR